MPILLRLALNLLRKLPPLDRRVRRIDRRREMAAGKRPLDWAAAEAVALASLADEGYRVRISGQDSERGTFSQRHAVLHDYATGRTFTPLKHVSREQAPVEVINSPLSEVAVLGYEYGYSLDCPEGLIAWEAQFGDFVNAAQVVIDLVGGCKATEELDYWQQFLPTVVLSSLMKIGNE